ncbi:MAG: ammonium transporter [Clostridia bacterium]|nr:ammonium transporter [Clostridia bacterium]
MYSSANTTWVLIAAALVFFMQAGFCILEAGLCRAKNTGNIIMKNLLDFCIGTPLYWLLGFGIMFGSANAFFGGIDFFAMGDYSSVLPAGVPFFAFFIFQTVFCGTSATIVSGAMAERTKFSAYCIYSAIISLIIYPVSGHWIWGGGWLAQLGFHDFAGSTAVHMVGGICAFIGAAFLGPRLGKYDKNGKPRAILGHNLLMAALGVFILWFCWFGFNGGSTVAMDSDAAMESASLVFYNTNLSAVIATVTVLIITWIRYKKPDVSMCLNGTLAGLVGVTAGCDVVDPFGAAAIGIICGFVVVFGIEFIDKVVKVDDPVGAVGVHCLCGSTGTLLTGLFATDGGLFYGGGIKFFGIQCLGVLSTAVWTIITISLTFFILKKTIGLRVTAEEEVQGMDISEHGLASAYSGFLTGSASDYVPAEVSEAITANKGSTPSDEAVPVVVKTAAPVASDVKMTKVEILCKQSKFEELKAAMNAIGITGMTVTQVLGCGMQKGKTEFYRGVEVEMNLLPKVCVEIVVCKVPVRDVIDAAKKVLYTGHIGDGKIFIYDVENVVKVRTGEEGYDALQDVE